MFAFKFEARISQQPFQSYCVANLSKTLHTNFYQNRSTFAEVMHKSILVFFYAPQCTAAAAAAAATTTTTTTTTTTAATTTTTAITTTQLRLLPL